MNEEDLTGKTIQGYFVQKPIGQGKFATVYKAETEDKRIVALKKIRIFEMNDPRLRDKCLKEVRLMQQLEHSNIIKYLDSFIANNELIIITEWAEKGDLKKVLKTAITAEVPIEEPKIWEYMHQIALALKHMHDKRIMHRDLKPANIFLSNDDVLKVGDFGLGRVFSEETVEAYSKVGTPLYMSPELLVGQGYDMKSDVWSLGCIVYEMCEQKSPFRNDNEKMSLMDLFNNITKGEYKPVSNRFSNDLRTTIQDMIVVDPQKRCDTNKVIEACQSWREKQKHSLKIDCLIVMEDVLEKLNLLEYRKNFCLPRNLKPISKTYFAVTENNIAQQEKFQYFIQLAYWLISLIQELRKKNSKAPEIGKPKLDDDPKAICKKLLDDLSSIDTPFNKNITPDNLSLGTDEAVCYVLNELINKRLILTNFQFLQPKIANADGDDEELAEDYGIKELDPSKVFNGDQRVMMTESDEDDDDHRGNKEYIQTINTTYHSNSTSATSTYTDQMYKFTKGSTGLKDEMIINEDGMMELDSVEWNKEVDRVTKELDDLSHKLDSGDAISVIQTSDERVYHLEGLKKYNSVNFFACLKESNKIDRI